MSLKIHNLSKTFKTPEGEKKVLEELDLEVRPGEVFALMGANGTGKTTLLKIISTLVLPDSGEVFACGINAVVSPTFAKSKIGLVCAADNSFYQMLTAEENIKFFARLYGPVPRDRITSVINGLGMENIIKTKFSHLSSGMRQRLALARALLVSPAILLADEVSRSLDENSADKVSMYIKEYVAKSNAACVVVTHDRVWAQKYSDRSGTLVNGKIIIL